TRFSRDWSSDVCSSDLFTVAVNVSALQLQRPDFVRQVRDCLARHGVPGDRLEIELTESSLMENVERVQGRLAELKGMGVHLSLEIGRASCRGGGEVAVV